MPPDFERLFIFGAGGHAREIAWITTSMWGYIDIVFLVDDPKLANGPVNGFPVRVFADEDIAGDSRYILGVGDPSLRARVASEFESRNARAATLVHAGALVSGDATIGAGSIVFPGSIVTSNAVVGRHTHVNLSSTISHDTRVGDFTTLSPGVHIAGNVHVGDRVFIGVGANISNGLPSDPLRIGDGSTIAAGACVLNHVPASAMVAGVPAARKR